MREVSLCIKFLRHSSVFLVLLCSWPFSFCLCSLTFKIAHDFSHSVNLKLYYYCRMKTFSRLLDLSFSPHTSVAWLHSQIPEDCDVPFLPYLVSPRIQSLRQSRCRLTVLRDLQGSLFSNSHKRLILLTLEEIREILFSVFFFPFVTGVSFDAT